MGKMLPWVNLVGIINHTESVIGRIPVHLADFYPFSQLLLLGEYRIDYYHCLGRIVKVTVAIFTTICPLIVETEVCTEVTVNFAHCLGSCRSDLRNWECRSNLIYCISLCLLGLGNL